MAKIDDELKKFLEGATGVCEATSCERSYLWSRWKERFVWEENCIGLWREIGKLADSSVAVNLWSITLDGHKIILVDPTSLVVDHGMIWKWLAKVMPVSAFHNGDPREGLKKTDATNFHCIVPPIKKKETV